MGKTAVVFSPKYYQHNPGADHPESAKRLQAIISELRRGQLSKSRKWEFVEPVKASIEDVGLVHGREYIRNIKSVCDSGGGLLDSGDTVVSPESFDVAFCAVGGALKAVNLVIEEKFENAFALVRPPGHHAERFRALGFCIFNNVAIAAQFLLKKHKLKRVLILDIDAHHGNGTQDFFYYTDEVLYISLHEDPRGFPGTGFTDEIGEDKGLGYNVNIPLPFGTDDQTYLRAIKEIVIPITCEYKPQFMLVSAGFDGYYADPVGKLSLSASCYSQIYQYVVNLASQVCAGKLVSVLEGGYNPKVIGKTAASAIGKMSGSQYTVSGNAPVSKEKVRIRAERVLKQVKKVQRGFWNIG
jgi:acetoin utilization deacetylase AcuC-like enzyme